MRKGWRKAYFGLLNRILFLPRKVSYETFPSINGTVKIMGWGELFFGEGVEINSGLGANPVGLSTKTIFSVAQGAKIIIGDRVGISNALFYAVKEIELEAEVLIGGGTQIIDSDFHSIHYQDRAKRQYAGVQSEKVHIKMGAFIGMNTIILKGVTVGARSVVAANSVVVRSIPDDELWGGNPAKLIRKLE